MSLLPADPVGRRAVLLAFLALSGLYFARTHVYLPIARQVESTRFQLERVEEGNRRAGAGMAMGESGLEQRLALYQEHIGRLEKLIPANEEVAALLEAVSEEAGKAGVEMTMMRPEPVEPGDYYNRLSYQVVVTGGYHQIGSFLAAIASLERIVAPGDLAITRGNPSGVADGAYDGTVAASFRIRTYAVSPAVPPGDAASPSSIGAPTS